MLIFAWFHIKKSKDIVLYVTVTQKLTTFTTFAYLTEAFIQSSLQWREDTTQ